MFVSKWGNLPPLPQISQTKCIIDIENMPLNINNQPSSSSSSPIRVDSLHRGPTTYRFPCQSKCAANSSSNQGHPRLVKSAPRPCPVPPADHFGVSPWDDLVTFHETMVGLYGRGSLAYYKPYFHQVGSSKILYIKLNNLFFSIPQVTFKLVGLTSSWLYTEFLVNIFFGARTCTTWKDAAGYLLKLSGQIGQKWSYNS